MPLRRREETIVPDRNYYDRHYYRGHIDSIACGDRFTRVKLGRIDSLLGAAAGLRVLDLGCGIGTVMLHLAGRGAWTVGLDFSETSLRIASTVFARKQTAFRGVCCDGRALALASASVDAVTAVDFTEHIDDSFLAATVREVFRVLKPGGRFVVYTPNCRHLFERLKARNILLRRDPSHIGMRPMKAYCEALRSAGFVLDTTCYETTHLPVYSLVEKIFLPLPVVGTLARRRICIRAVKKAV